MDGAQFDGDDKVVELERQHRAMEEDFGKRRAKFKEMFLQKEEELKQQQQRVADLQAQLDDARTELAVAEVTFENQLDVVRRKHVEEMASIQHLEKEQASSFLEDHVLRYQTEIRQLRGQLRQLQQQQQPEEAGFGPHVLTAVTKQLAKKITLGGAVTSTAGASPHGSQENLDHSMKRAQEDTEMIRSLVIPLEEEIAALKQKLRSTDAQLQVQLTAREQLIRADQVLMQLHTGGRLDELAEQLRLQLPSKQPPHELVPHLYLYISLLEAQKLGITDDLSYGKQTQSELRAQLAQERAALADMRLTCKRTSDQLTETQRHHLAQTSRLRVELPADLLPLLDMASPPPSPSPPASQRSLDTLDRAQSDAELPAEPVGGSLPQDVQDSSSCSSQRTVDRADVTSVGRYERCSTLEPQQQQQLQTDLKAAEKRRSELERALERHQQDLGREARYRKQMEQEWQLQAEQYEKQVSELHRSVEAGERGYHKLELRHKQFVSDIQDKLRRLTADRHMVQQELNRMQAENDTLLGKYSASADELQNEFINLPDQVEELHMMLLRCKEDLISAKIAREHVEETLRNQLAFTKNEQEALQHEKDALSDELMAEVNKLREQVALRDSVSSELKAEQARRQEADAELTAVSDQLTQQTAKSRQIVAALQSQLEQQSSSKSSLTDEVTRLKTKVATLQLDLDNSEAVQRDFVKLSQSLQMELERIRQSDTEVRWQHEDDVDTCNKCHSRFSVGKRKYHCRHCGKIFCHDCLSQAVPSGPNGTMSRVCEVCHTLLNRESAPYFSSEAPGNSAD